MNDSDTMDESEETLSLCDLPLYSDQSADWDQDFSLLGSNSVSSSHDDHFEFFSQELNPSATTNTTTAATGIPPENIIFCGRLIPYKQKPTCDHQLDSSNIDIKNQSNNKKKRGWRMFKWKFISSRSSKSEALSKNGTRSTTSLKQQSPKKMYNTKKLGNGHGTMSLYTASSSSGKVKWYLLLFGISKVPSMVELRDIRSRQSRRHCPSPPPLPPSSPPPPPPMFGFRNHDDMVSDRGWGLWGLIRALSCG